MKVSSLHKIFNIMRQDRKQGVELLYRKYYNKLYGIAFSVVKDSQFSENAIHNAIYKLLTMEENLLPTCKELSWIYRVVKNESLMLLRKESKIISVEIFEKTVADDKNIEDYVDMEEFYSLLKPLDDRRKEIVALKVLGGYTHKEIADMTGNKQGTIQWLYCTSIKALRRALSALASIVLLCVGGIGVFGALIIDALGKNNGIAPPTLNDGVVFPGGDKPSSSGGSSVAGLTREEGYLIALLVLAVVAVIVVVTMILIFCRAKGERKIKR